MSVCLFESFALCLFPSLVSFAVLGLFKYLKTIMDNHFLENHDRPVGTKSYCSTKKQPIGTALDLCPQCNDTMYGKASNICNKCRLAQEYCKIKCCTDSQRQQKKCGLKSLPVKLNLFPYAENAQAYEHFSIFGDSQKCCESCFLKIERYVYKEVTRKENQSLSDWSLLMPRTGAEGI